ncbi:hypothetical protein RCZ01_13930 [Capnocytophaga felis]|uniref:Adhesin domain-containing protein n=2 Tax=Capnocytophaga felis TaxID=2267611 RepID=A0A5M4B903_9FLAO|nr:hypothetical protein RCZ01_13930 [Capnocytophaga felis]GET48883.1 hypothetical protein RCZ02_17140 [Capnocytophaga felis]
MKNSPEIGKNDSFIQYKHTETKTIRKEFKVNESASLFVANKYGTITLITDENNTNKINIEVQIKVSSNNPSDVQERIKQISVDFSNSGSNYVSAKTIIDNNSSFFKSFGQKKSISFQINYTISLPEKIKISLENEYGDIFINKTQSFLKINADYGSVNLGDILSDAEINLEYSPNSSIDQIKNLNLNADYSKMNIGKANYIKANCDYTNLSIDRVKEIVANMDYNGISISELEKGQIYASYCGVSVGKVSENITIDSDYGGIKLKEILPHTNLVKINAEYAGISLGYHPNWEFQYEFFNSYGKISVPENLPYTKKNVKMMETTVSGKKGSGKNTFIISSKYAGIKIYEN